MYKITLISYFDILRTWVVYGVLYRISNFHTQIGGVYVFFWQFGVSVPKAALLFVSQPYDLVTRTRAKHGGVLPEETGTIEMQQKKVEEKKAYMKSLEKELQDQQDFATSKVVEFQETRKALLIQQVELRQLGAAARG